MATKKYPIDSDPFDSKTFEKIFEGISGGNGLLDGFNLDQSERIENGTDVINFSPGSFILNGRIIEVNHTIRISGIFEETEEADTIFFIDTGSDIENEGIHLGWGLAKAMVSKDGRESLFNPPFFVFGEAEFGTHHYGPQVTSEESDVETPIVVGKYEVGNSQEYLGPIAENTLRGTDPSRAKIVFLAYKKNGRFYRNPNIVFPAKLLPGDSFEVYDNGEEEFINPKPWFDVYNNSIHDIFQVDVGNIYISSFVEDITDDVPLINVGPYPVDDMADSGIKVVFTVNLSNIGSLSHRIGPLPVAGVYADALWATSGLSNTIDGFVMGGDVAEVSLSNNVSDYLVVNPSDGLSQQGVGLKFGDINDLSSDNINLTSLNKVISDSYPLEYFDEFRNMDSMFDFSDDVEDSFSIRVFIWHDDSKTEITYDNLISIDES